MQHYRRRSYHHVLIYHINWDKLVLNGGNEIPEINYNISVSSKNMIISINVELDYLGYSYIDNKYMDLEHVQVII